MKRSKFLDFVWFVIRLPAIFLMTFWALMKGTKDMWHDLREREELERQAEEARKPYAAELEKLKKFNPHELKPGPLTKYAQTCTPTGKDLVLPFEVCCDFLTAYSAYKKVPSHAHAKQLAGFMEFESDKLAQVTSMKEDLKTLDRPEFDRIVNKFYLAFYEVDEAAKRAAEEQATYYKRVNGKVVQVPPPKTVFDKTISETEVDMLMTQFEDENGPV